MLRRSPRLFLRAVFYQDRNLGEAAPFARPRAVNGNRPPFFLPSCRIFPGTKSATARSGAYPSPVGTRGKTDLLERFLRGLRPAPRSPGVVRGKRPQSQTGYSLVRGVTDCS